MALDAATLALTAAELKTTLTDAKIAKLFEPTRDELVLTLRTRTDTYSLLLSARSGSARVCLTEESFENPETPPSAASRLVCIQMAEMPFCTSWKGTSFVPSRLSGLKMTGWCATMS